MPKEFFDTIFIQSHLGLGDMLVANAIFRHYGASNGVVTCCKHHNVPSVEWMLRGAPVALLKVKDDASATQLCNVAAKRHKVLRLGMFGKNFDEKRWDQCMFEQAGIPFEKRWTDFKVERDLSREFEPPEEPYAFVHEDEKRGFRINKERVPWRSDIDLYFVEPNRTPNIFDYCRLIENATELHLIDSCFAILADSMTTLKAKRKVVHLYSRPGALPPTYQPGWEILK